MISWLLIPRLGGYHRDSIVAEGKTAALPGGAYDDSCLLTFPSERWIAHPPALPKLAFL